MLSTEKVISKIVNTRKAFWMSQQVFSKLIWLDRWSYSQLELWKRKIPIEDLERIARVYETNVVNILNNKERIIYPYN